MPSATSGAYGGRTLDTLPTEVKNEIFSHFLLSKNVKYSTNGKYPGHKYKFNTSIMRVNKRLKQDATTYLHSHNSFVLIHVKFFAFEIDQGRFLPVVAVGNAAKSFKSPAVEATIKHQSTKCMCTVGSDCSIKQHHVPEKVTRALLMAEDLDIFIRQLRLAYHIWPTLPIYIHSAPGDSPVEWSASPAQTLVNFVWKINKPFRQDLTQAELRDRHIRLLAPLTKLVNHGQKVKILGAEQDLISDTIKAMTPRLLSLDAVGWDLYDLLQAEKQYLDQIPNNQTMKQRELSDAYQSISCLGWFFADTKESNTTAFVFKADHPSFDNPEGVPLAYWSMEKGQYDHDSSSWQFGVLVLCLDCTITMVKMALDLKMHNTAKFFIHFCKTIMETPYFLFPDEIQSAVWHYDYFFQLWDSGLEKRPSAYTGVLRVLDSLLLQGAANEFEDEYVRQDRNRIARIVSREIKLCNHDEHNFPGLKRRQRILNTKVNLHRPEGSGSMSPDPPLSADLVALIIRIADKRMTGGTDEDEDEDEDSDDDDSDEDGDNDEEAEHSDDDGWDDVEDSDEDETDEVEDSDDNDDSDEGHDCLGVFNPRHVGQESMFFA